MCILIIPQPSSQRVQHVLMEMTNLGMLQLTKEKILPVSSTDIVICFKMQNEYDS